MVSVIINVYNGEKFIKKCLDCIINQTYKNLEILVINDGSTDNTLKICKSYKDKRIRIITTENLVLSLSRNIGIDEAKGEYLYFMDVDDFIELDTIEYLYNLCKKYKTLISTSKVIDIYGYNFKIKKIDEKIDILSQEEMLTRILLWQNRTEALWNKLIHKSLFKDLRFEKRIVNDIAFTYKLIMNTNKVAYTNQIKYYHLLHIENISTKKRDNLERMEDMYNAIVERYNYIKKINPSFYMNEVGLIDSITRLYFSKSKNIKNLLIKLGAIKLYNEVFTFKMIKYKINFREKVRLILFRINPNLYNIIIKLYLMLKRTEKNI